MSERNQIGASLLDFVKKIERKAKRQKEIGSEIDKLKAEAEKAGFPRKLVTAIIARRKEEEAGRSTRLNRAALLALFEGILGLAPSEEALEEAEAAAEHTLEQLELGLTTEAGDEAEATLH